MKNKLKESFISKYTVKQNLSFKNYIIYKIFFFFLEWFLIILPYIQIKFINIYTVLLNLDRLPFRILPIFCKKYLFITATPET